MNTNPIGTTQYLLFTDLVKVLQNPGIYDTHLIGHYPSIYLFPKQTSSFSSLQFDLKCQILANSMGNTGGFFFSLQGLLQPP